MNKQCGGMSPGHLIVGITPGSIAEECGIEPGDRLLAIDGQNLIDRIDYEYFSASNELTLSIEDQHSKEAFPVEIEKEDDENLGLIFSDVLMSQQRCCANACPFCFVDQMKEGLRETLYVKDDDWRMSFLMGNFITLTNVGDGELQRIIDRKVSPLFISVQATEPKLREYLLKNHRAGLLMEQLRKLADGGLQFHGQFVLCPGLNDGEALERSLTDLWSLGPAVISTALVPVGLTQYREDLTQIESYTRETALAVVDAVERWQERAYRETGRYFVSASDEFYVLAGREPPPGERYEGYPQIENGVGMLRKFDEEFKMGLKALSSDATKPLRCSIATGISAYPWIQEKVDVLGRERGLQCGVYPIENAFFGPSVTVAGLVVGTDIARQLAREDLGDALYIPNTMLRAEDDLFLDGSSLQDLEQALGLPVVPLATDGFSFAYTLAGTPVEGE